MRSMRTDMLATAWSAATNAVWLVPLATADVWDLPVVLSALAGVAAGALLPKYWVRPREFERSYHRLGVRHFKTVVVFGDWMNRLLARMGWSRPFPLTAERMERWLVWTRVAERIHFAWLLGSLPLVYAAFEAGRNGLAVYVLCGNIPFNVYPILLQRYTRARLERMLGRRRGEPEEAAA